MNIWFWQLIISPHMANLAKSLTELGHHVTFVAEQEMSAERAAQGWSVPDVGSSKIILAHSKDTAISLAQNSPSDAIHICEGIRANGAITAVQYTLKKMGRKQLVVMETVNDQGWQGIIKRVLYTYLFYKISPHLSGILATGENTRNWIIKRGVPANKVFPFAYFLPITTNPISHRDINSEYYRILYVGQLIERKRLDLLITAISQLKNEMVELTVIGSGPLENKLKILAEAKLPNRVKWLGILPMDKVKTQMTITDCLVLPSQHDGWGAVVSEALINGTPAICSDACGAAVVVKASAHGGVFPSGNSDELVTLLNIMINEGKLTEQQSQKLSDWAHCLGGPAGARYLENILVSINSSTLAPLPPWSRAEVEKLYTR